MRVQDLGAIDRPLLVFGGVYSNFHALQALFAQAAAFGFADDQLINTGDAVAYCAAPQACVEALRKRGIASIAGNVERALAAGDDECGCGFKDGSTCDLLSRGWYPYAQSHVNDAARGWMTGLPDLFTFTHYGRRVMVLHGGATDVSAFIWPDDATSLFEAEITALGAVHIVLAGHCGLGFQRRIGAVDWVNAGAIGMPPNDGCPQTRFGILTENAFRLETLNYDHVAAAKAMHAAGLTQGYERGLITGYWPSEDILPPSLRRVT